MVSNALAGFEVDHRKERIERIASRLKATAPELCVAPPGGMLEPLLCQLERDHPRFAYVHRADNAVAFAAGAALAGHRGLVLLPGSGLEQAATVVASLVMSFKLPMGFVLSSDEHKIEDIGHMAGPVLAELGLPWRVVTAETEQESLHWFEQLTGGVPEPAALLMAPGLFSRGDAAR